MLVLESIENVLTVYKCLPGTCLQKRVNWVYEHIKPGSASLYVSEKTKVNMLISELEAFLDSF